MLTDKMRGPFLVETTFTEAKNPPWDNSFWSWRLIGFDGECLESGTGHATEIDARMTALAVSRNEMA